MCSYEENEEELWYQTWCNRFCNCFICEGQIWCWPQLCILKATYFWSSLLCLENDWYLTMPQQALEQIYSLHTHTHTRFVSCRWRLGNHKYKLFCLVTSLFLQNNICRNISAATVISYFRLAALWWCRRYWLSPSAQPISRSFPRAAQGRSQSDGESSECQRHLYSSPLLSKYVCATCKYVKCYSGRKILKQNAGHWAWSNAIC